MSTEVVTGSGRQLIALPFVAALAILIGCSSKPTKEFSLTLIVADKLGNSEVDKLPEEVIELSMPLEECDEYLLLPKSSLYRLGYAQSTAMSLASRVESGFAGNRDNPRFVRRELTKRFAAKTLGEVFARPADEDLDMRGAFDTYIGTMGQQSLGIVYTSSAATDTKFEGMAWVTSIDRVRTLMAKEVCENGGAPVFVFLDPPMGEDLAPEEPEADGTDDNHTIETALEQDAILQELAAKNREAGEVEEEHARKTALGKVKGEIEERTEQSDYRYKYELMKNRIYGERHHEAFDLLEEAAEIALEQGQAAYLLDRMNGDKEGDLWKLAHGHADKWNTIVEALEHEDEGRLHGH